MKFLKNLTLISLLLAACIPTETQTAPQVHSVWSMGNPTPHPYSWLLFNTHTIAAIIVAPVVLFYVPYVFFTRHKKVENFVKKQKDIESYSIAIKLNQPKSNQLLEQSFTETDYKIVINKALDWTKAHTFPGLRATFKPSIKLLHSEKIYPLRSVKRGIASGYSPKNKKTAFWEKSKRILIKRFELPTSENITHATKIEQGILSGFIWTAVSVFFGIPFIPIATLSLPFLALSYHSSAKNFIEQPEDIESYAVTVKIRHQCETIQEQMFTSPDPKLVITQALHYAQQEQTADFRVFFEPTIKLVDYEKTYSLRRITKAKLPKDTATHDLYWKKIESKLTDRLIVPTEIVTSTPYQGRLAFFGAAMALWILKPPCILV